MMKKRMQHSLKVKKRKSLAAYAAAGIMTLAAVLGLGSFLPSGGIAVTAEAAENEGKEGDWDAIEMGKQPYTYTINVYAGKEGYFSSTGTSQKSVTVPAGQAASISMSDLVVKNPDQYYARGMKIAGHDNDEISTRDYRSYTWPAENGGLDQDYNFSVAYGITGGMVKYYVDYIEVDANGNPVQSLLAREEYYGMVDDKPVVSYQYVPGYRPNAYNLGKTLVDSKEPEKDNLFTFTYTRIPQPTAAPVQTVINTVTTAATPAPTATPAGTTGTGTAGTAGTTNGTGAAGAAGATNGTGAAGTTGTTDTTGTAGTTGANGATGAAGTTGANGATGAAGAAGTTDAAGTAGTTGAANNANAATGDAAGNNAGTAANTAAGGNGAAGATENANEAANEAGNTASGADAANAAAQNTEPAEYIDLDEPDVPLAGVNSLEANSQAESSSQSATSSQTEASSQSAAENAAKGAVEKTRSGMKPVIWVIVGAAAAAVIGGVAYSSRKRKPDLDGIDDTDDDDDSNLGL
ncbi:MAG: hypothetical protein K5852_03910 [Eubacterium sp.]|nr:hypothetical protein [Eubacterium sp.]